MPIPFAAAASVAAVIGVTQQCQRHDDDEEKGEMNTDQEDPPPTSNVTSLRSIDVDGGKPGSSSSSGSDLRYGSVVLHKKQRSPSTDNASPLREGFVDGNFSSGQVHMLDVEKCHVVSYHDALLAVATARGLEFYDSRTYAPMHVAPSNETIVALAWQGDLLVACSTQGFWLYHVNIEILEAQGVTLLYDSPRNSSSDPIHCVHMCYLGKLDPTLVIALGHGSGCVSLWSFGRESYDPANFTVHVDYLDHERKEMAGTPVLSIDVAAANNNMLVVGTEGGDVAVHALSRTGTTSAVRIGERLWYTERRGAVRSVRFFMEEQWRNSNDRNGANKTIMPSRLHEVCWLVLGGYDKTVAVVDTTLWAVARELPLHGTINVIALDRRARYLAVGCRDKSLTLFDTSTYVPIKSFYTPGWVTSLSWQPNHDNILAVRTDHASISILDLTPIHKVPVRLSATNDEESSLSWDSSGRMLARSVGNSVIVADALGGHFEDVASCKFASAVTNVAFCPSRRDRLAVVEALGTLSLLYMREDRSHYILQVLDRFHVEDGLKALAWSPDGSCIAVGGSGKMLHIFNAQTLKAAQNPVPVESKIWEIAYCPAAWNCTPAETTLALALGDYTALLLNAKLEPILQISRVRTVRCLHFHPYLPLMAIGDGAGIVSVLDLQLEEFVKEIDVGNRVNAVCFSPAGDYLLVAADNGCVSLFELSEYSNVQDAKCSGFALSAAFSPSGCYVAMGCSVEAYTVLRLGPFLGIDMIPLNTESTFLTLPSWALREALFRSGDGPSYIQRHMLEGATENLRRVGVILRDYPGALFAYDRATHEGCYDTAIKLRKPNLLKLAVTTLVDGTLDAYNDGNQSILTTPIPEQARSTLFDIVENFSAAVVLDIFSEMTFQKVPFTRARIVSGQSKKIRGSASYTDPWADEATSQSLNADNTVVARRGDLLRTPAVLPLPGLGEMDFLARLLANVPATVFDNEAMALVLKVLWQDHIWKYFMVDTFCFVVFCAIWMITVEKTVQTDGAIPARSHSVDQVLVFLTIAGNSVFAAKEVVQSRYGRRSSYFSSPWNLVDVMSIVGVYLYCVELFVNQTEGEGLVVLSVITTLFLTVKFLSYLRGFGDTGWLVSVLAANFHDVRGFLIILFSILIGFSLSFRALFAATNEEAFGSMRRAFFSTFELAILGTYDPMLLYESKYTVLSAFVFVLAITCVLVVALSALISILADSYARVQEKATANRRKERAELIVEYMSLLPPWKRHKIENETRWFHTLLETDSAGDLLVHKDDWEGGLNALRHDMQRLDQEGRAQHDKALQALKADFDNEIASLRKEMMCTLVGIADDVKKMRKVQSQGVVGAAFGGKNVARAVRAVKSVGGAVRGGGGGRKSNA